MVLVWLSASWGMETAYLAWRVLGLVLKWLGLGLMGDVAYLMLRMAIMNWC